MLEHHADAEGARLRRAVEHDRAAHEAQLARARLDQAVNDFDERRLAGTVLAEQRVDFRRPQVEIDRVVCAQVAEALADADGLQQRTHLAARADAPSDSVPRNRA